MMIKYEQFSATELAADPFFQEWVLEPTEKSQTFWSEFLVAHPGCESTVQEATEIVTRIRSAFEGPSSDPAVLHQHFDTLTALAESAASGTVQHRPPVQRQTSHPYLRKVTLRRWAVAASWLLIASVAWVLWQANQFVTYETDFGEWQTITLPDQSSVILNANSEIKLPKSWKKDKDRQVWLNGEAFFAVEKTQGVKRKFIVTTEDLSVEVLGTSFNVSTRKEQTSVYLEEGKIQLNMGESVEHMVPGNYIAYSSEQEEIVEREDQTNANKSTWHTGVLVLEEKTVEEIAEKLEEIYGVEFVLEDERQAQRVVTVRLPLKKLDVVIPILESLLETTITYTENNQLIIA